MADWTVEVRSKPEYTDAEGIRIRHDVADLGMSEEVGVRVSALYWVSDALDRDEVVRLADRLLTDAVLQDYSVQEAGIHPDPGSSRWIVDVRLRAGVTDAVGESVAKGARDLGITGLGGASTGRRIYLSGDIDHEAARRIAERLLVNDVIQTYELRSVGAGPS